ncbi:MAG: hypothetical protein OHK0052_25930 [Anaerolineales bacterium]
MSSFNSFKNTLRLLRREMRRWQAARRWGDALSRAPILFGNSFPKSGTHLLTQILEGCTAIGPAVVSGLPAVVTFNGFTGRARTTPEILTDLQRFKPGDVGYGHLHARPQIVEALCASAFAAFFILRDPRDVVVSHVHYVTEMEPRHAHHAYYQNLPDFDARLMTSITGIPDEAVLFPPVGERFAPFVGFLQREEILTLRYEDFLTERRATLEKIVAHLRYRNFPIAVDDQRALDALEAAINPQKSPTFRSGKAGGWRDKFTPEHTRVFKELAADVLIALGYEKDDNW